jgi:ubiquinone/menaquinone biosynthesis C-methylase UbiE
MFWNRVAGIYDISMKLLNRKANSGASAYVASVLSPSDEVLECACGTGIFTVKMAPCCKSVLAMDFAPNMLKKARKKCGKFRNVRFEHGDILNLLYPDSSFDVVVAANVIHLLDEPKKAFLEMLRVVRREGKIIIPTYINRPGSSSRKLSGLFNKMGANFRQEFDLISYKLFIRDMAIQSGKDLHVSYFVAEGRMPCCVAILEV